MTGIPDPAVTPTLDVPVAGALFGFHRSKSYVEARRYIDTDGAEGLPTIVFGSTLRCPTAACSRCSVSVTRARRTATARTTATAPSANEMSGQPTGYPQHQTKEPKP